MPAPGPKKSIVATHRQADDQGEQGEAEGGDLTGAVLGPEVPLQKEKDGHHRNDGQHDIIEELVRQDEVQPGPRPGPRQGRPAAPGGAGHRTLPAARSGRRRAGCPTRSPHLLVAEAAWGQSGQQIGGEGDQPAAAGHRVHESPRTPGGQTISRCAADHSIPLKTSSYWANR